MRLSTILRTVILAAVMTALAAPAAFGSTSGVVIGQVYGGGGNGGAPYTHDYVELFNAGTTTVSLDGWSLQYGSATGLIGGAGAPGAQITPLTGPIAPGQRLLVQEATNAAVGAALPTPDITDATPISMSATAGKIALVDGATNLGCSGAGTTPCAPAQLARILDLVGYGAGATFFEGAGPAPAPSATLADFRAAGGCTDADNNAADFSTAAANPRNSSATATPCGTAVDDVAVVSSVPADGATAVALNADITLTFNKPVEVDADFATLTCATSGSHSLVVGGSGATRTLNPAPDFAGGESCTLTVVATRVHDAGNPSNTLPADRTVQFTTAGAPPALTPIHDIQGAAHLSPLVGTSVTTSGIVTAKRSSGFWIQDPSPDANPATSEGILVFGAAAATAVTVGDSVSVSGTVVEFRAGGAANLALTEISSPTVSVLSSGNALPAAQLVGPGGRSPDSMIIEDDATNVETGGVFDPDQDGIDFYESLEGMLVTIGDAVATGPTSAFPTNRELPVLPGDGAGAGLRTPRGGIIVRENDFNPERIILNDIVSGGPKLPLANVGDRFPGPTVGVIDYAFSNFKLQLTTLPARVDGGIQRETTTPAGAGQLTFGTFNVENLDPGDGAAKFSELATLIVDNLRAPDIISLEEIQDNDGPPNDSTVVAADATYDMLIAAISAAGGPTYQFRQIDPVDDQDGGEPGGNIRVGFLFRTDRGVSFVDRPGGGATTAVSVQPGPALSSSPGRIDPLNPAFDNSRKPLVGEFRYDGRTVFVIANHWNSKGGDQPLFGVNQPPVLSSQAQRVAQAQIVHDFVAELLAQDPNARVAVLGDLNDFYFSDPLQTLIGTGPSPILEDLYLQLPADERYSYVFQGNSQDLDHIVVSRALADRLASFDVVHVNSEFADQISDHDPLVATFTLRTPSLPAVARATTGFRLRDSLTTGDATTTFSYGARPSVPLMGDWDGDGSRTPGSYQAGAFKLRNSNTAGEPNQTFVFGDRRGFPVAGDFDGDGIDDVGVFRNGLWQVRYSDDSATESFAFGSGTWPATVPVAGDWDGDGTDGIGTYTRATASWRLRNAASGGTADVGPFVEGAPNASYPVVGDWNADGTDSVGTRQEGTWTLRNANSPGAPDLTFDFGDAGDLPLSWRVR